MSVIPFTDFFLISWYELFRYAESLIYLRARVLRIFFFPTEREREGLFLERLCTDNSRDESHDTIDPYQARELSAREDVFTDRYFCDIEEFEYTFIDPFIVSAYYEIFPISWSIWLCRLLIVDSSSRREIYDPIVYPILLLEISESLSEWLYREDRSGTSSVWTIIDSTCIAYCPVREVMDKILKEPLFLGSFHDTTIEIWSHAPWKEREYMECDHIILYRRFLHRRRVSFSLGLRHHLPSLRYWEWQSLHW